MTYKHWSVHFDFTTGPTWQTWRTYIALVTKIGLWELWCRRGEGIRQNSCYVQCGCLLTISTVCHFIKNACSLKIKYNKYWNCTWKHGIKKMILWVEMNTVGTNVLCVLNIFPQEFFFSVLFRRNLNKKIYNSMNQNKSLSNSVECFVKISKPSRFQYPILIYWITHVFSFDSTAYGS